MNVSKPSAIPQNLTSLKYRKPSGPLRSAAKHGESNKLAFKPAYWQKLLIKRRADRAARYLSGPGPKIHALRLAKLESGTRAGISNETNRAADGWQRRGREKAAGGTILNSRVLEHYPRPIEPEYDPAKLIGSLRKGKQCEPHRRDRFFALKVTGEERRNWKPKNSVGCALKEGRRVHD